MVQNEAPRLIMKKVAVNVALLVAASALFIFLTSLLEGGDVGFPAMIIVTILLAALSFDVFTFAAKNPTRELTVRFSDPRTEERLEAILEVLGYRLFDSQGNTRIYKPSFWIGGMNGKVTIRYSPSRAIVTGPLFAIERVEERLWLFSYADISWYESDGRPESQQARQQYDYNTTMDQMAPYGNNTGYEPVGGTPLAGGR